MARAAGFGPLHADQARTDTDQEDGKRDQIERDETPEQRLDVEEDADRQQQPAKEQ